VPAESPRPQPAPRTALVALISLALALVACAPDRTDAREWLPSDHDQPPGGASASAARPQNDASSLVELAWRKNCASCHGVEGRGDGPQGPMAGAPDLTRAELLSARTDAQLAESIRKGKNRMPAFDLPPSIIDGLVKRLRERGAK
jgi:mono/diheme cytochrome c family protein